MIKLPSPSPTAVPDVPAGLHFTKLGLVVAAAMVILGLLGVFGTFKKEAK
jgi:hypothetical protein